MVIVDVNILVHAHRAEAPEHPLVAGFLRGLMNGGRPFGVPEIAFSGLVRITTQPAFKPPSTLDDALGFCQAVKASRHCLVLQPGEAHWSTFERLCRSANARGKVVADAYLAAFAIDLDGEWVTTDRDFGKFPGLRWRHPHEAHARTNPR